MESKVAHIPISRDDFRAPTGPMAFEGDWPGYFIRGDDALAFAGMMRRASVEDDGENAKRLCAKLSEMFLKVRVDG